MIEVFKTIGFINPYALWGLLSIPIIYYVVRSFPPAPKTFEFSSIYLLKSFNTKITTKSNCPLWLLIFRIFLILLLIAYYSKPYLDKSKINKDIENYVVYTDLGWSLASEWNKYKNTIHNIMLEANTLKKNFYLVNNSDKENNDYMRFSTTKNLFAYFEKNTPNPWQINTENLLENLNKLKFKKNSRYFYIFSNYDIQSIKKRNIIKDIREKHPDLKIINLVKSVRLIEEPIINGEKIQIKVKRFGELTKSNFVLKITSYSGQIVLSKTYEFADKSTTTTINEKFPISVINQLKKIEIIGERHAAATFFFDDFHKKKEIGILLEGKSYEKSPFLSPVYYIEKALNKENKIIFGKLDKLLDSKVNILIFPDKGEINTKLSKNLEKWLSSGGLLIRFSGPKLAKKSSKFLTTDNKNIKIRFMGGTLSQKNTIGIEDFPNNSIFRDLIIPKDIIIKKQLLLDFKNETSSNILASLKDGTPLVSSKDYGKGKILLFHFTANNDWSNIPMTSLFVDMLARATLLNQIDEINSFKEVNIKYQINGFGELEKTDKIIKSRDSFALRSSFPNKRNIPGIYENEELSIAFNLAGKVDTKFFEDKDFYNRKTSDEFSKSVYDLSNILLFLFLIISALDILVSSLLKNNINLFKIMKNKMSIINLFILFILLSKFNYLEANNLANGTYLAYVKNKDQKINEISYRGLLSLSKALDRRTSISPKGVEEINLSEDDIYYFPIIYWPTGKELTKLVPKIKIKIKNYLNNGGIILFDASAFFKDISLGKKNKYREITKYFEQISLNELTPISNNHTLSRSFYLLNNYPGRWDRGTLLVDSNSINTNDGVSSIILGFNDWASAWAFDDNNFPLFPVVPGGERQRELAFRVGINVIMYALTGNYKNDQIHSKSILNRLRKN